LEKEDPVLMSLKDEVKRRGILGIHAKRIYDKYFNGELSLMEVNVPKRETELILKLLKQKKANLQIFDEVLYYVRSNLASLYSQLSLTTEFMKYQKQKEIEKQLMEKTQKKLGLIGYVKKLLGNFQKNVKRKASILGSRRGSSFSSNSLNESNAASDQLESIHNDPTELKDIEKKEVYNITIIKQPATGGDSEMEIVQSSNNRNNISPQQQQQNSRTASSSSRQVIITESKRSAKSRHHHDKQDVSEI